MKYFIQYPGYLVCNLRCPYCFHIKELTTGLTSGGEQVGCGGPNFTIDEYLKWRDTHLKDREEIVIHFHGGEPTLKANIDLITSFYKSTQEEKLDVLSNGTGPIDNYNKLIDLKPFIFRIGFTYHRKVIGNKPELRKLFVDRVLKIKKAGISLYVKEMLFKEEKQEILANQRFWSSLQVPFKIQDFKGYTQGEDFTELHNYTIDDLNLIDKEYIKQGTTCSCLPGYRQIMIRGDWQAGDILGCWIDPIVVGNIKENTYNPNYKVEMSPYAQKSFVTGVPKIYKGTYDGDRYYDNLKKKS
jgi:organic radical activating enzyme